MESCFTNKQKKEIKKAMITIYKDIKELLEKAEVTSYFTVQLQHQKPDVDYNHFRDYIFENEWFLNHYEDGRLRIVVDCGFKDKRCDLVCYNKDQTFALDDELLLKLEFVERYPENRKLIIDTINKMIPQEIKRREKQKESQTNIDDRVSNGIKEAMSKLKQAREASIEFNFPSSVAPYEIEVTKEDGRTVGTIDFGDRTIKVITDGNIVLVPKREEKIKVKEK